MYLHLLSVIVIWQLFCIQGCTPTYNFVKLITGGEDLEIETGKVSLFMLWRYIMQKWNGWHIKCLVVPNTYLASF